MKTQTLIGVLVALLIIGFGIWYIAFSRNAAPEGTVPAAGELTIDGSITCLPHHDEQAPHTMECAYGLRGEDGNYYGLSSTDSSTITSIPTGTRVTVHGIFTPGADATYSIVGTIAADRITPQGGTAQTTSDGTISFKTPSSFGLATSPEQILVSAYIPPCEEGFTYCLYYTGTGYAGTNFESAGVAIRTRADLTSREACLTKQPDGYTGLHATTTEQAAYPMSIFRPLGDAGAGHYATGEEYRLYTGDTCYQFDTRVGETQFANYPEGTVKEFTDAERDTLLATLRTVIGSMTLATSGQALAPLPR